MTHKSNLRAQLNQVYSECVDTTYSSPDASIFRCSEECQNLVMLHKTYIKTDQIESFEMFKMLLNSPFFDRIQALKEFRKRKQRIIDEECKRQILENSVSDITLDIERLTDQERVMFDKQYGEMVNQMLEQIARLPSPNEIHGGSQHHFKINYRIFDFEAVYQLRVDMLEYLLKRDVTWVPQLMPKQ